MRSTLRTAAATSTAIRGARRPAFPADVRAESRWRPSAVMYTSPQHAKLECSGQRHDDEQDDGRRGGRRGIPEAKPGFVDIEQQQGGGVVRSAARHYDDVVNNAEGIDYRVDQDEQRCRHQQWQG